jgi:DNA (cytosine-5)-methyltransferase 1
VIFIELFAGIGGFRLGLEATGHQCVWANEWLEKPRRIYAKQFGEQPDERDIRTVSGSELPEADLICGGFPCATFSIAGKRSGFDLEDARGTLAFEMFRLARDRGIPYILFENVKGLLNHDEGRTFGVILEILDGLGYDAQWELLDSKNFGVPQHRERVFLIANIRGKPRPKVFPIGETGAKDAGEGASGQPEILQFIRRENQFRRFTDGISPTLLAHMGTGGGNVPFIHARSHTQSNMVDRNRQSDYIWTLDSTPQNKMGVSLDGKSIRKLTCVECERLQGLPDDFTKWMKMDDGTLKQATDSERYERCGRTVTIQIIEAIGRKLGYEWY